ncbi:MAG TPA: D-alanyl-D-alanine carboxypeptidase [Desulfotomaculum sp.]|nr:D-alanyl-D-alanine carboxypeptidase [Desulfotomaculum sp.]
MRGSACLVVFFLLVLFAGPVYAHPRPQVTAKAAVLVDADSGVVYYDKNGERRREPASLTKVMTCILALELADPDEEVEVSARTAATWIGSCIGLRRGEVLKLEELVKAALICSANDATVAIAEGVAGDYDTFILWMNAKAVLLGMKKTRFGNTHGLPHPNHYTTAKDLSVLARYALLNPRFASVVRMPQAAIHWIKPVREVEVGNTNRLLQSSSFPGVTGVKTGTTSRAGKCLIASASRGPRSLIAVVLGSYSRYGDAVGLLSWGFEELKKSTVCHRGEYYTRTRVRKGRAYDVPLVADRDVILSLPREERYLLQKELVLFRPPVAPVRPGERLGEVVFTWRGQELGRAELVAGERVDKLPWYRFWH